MATASRRGGLRIGVGSRDITPEGGALLVPTGMGRLEPTRGALDAVRAEALAIDAGGEAAFVVTSDLRTLEHEWVVEIREAVSAATGCNPERVLLSSVHNHCSSPIAADDSPEAKAACVAADRKIVDGLIGACLDAWASRRPAEIGFATASVGEGIGLNRRMRLSNGTCVNQWGSGPVAPPGKRFVGPGGPMDPVVHVLAVREPGSSAPFAVLTSYATHPHLGAIPMWSGEFPGAAKRAVEAQLPGAMALYGNYTGGDMDLHVVHPIPPTGMEDEIAWFSRSAALLGERFARVVVPAVRGIAEWSRPTQLRSAYWSWGEEGTEKPRLILMLGVVTLGDVALVSMPGELFNSFGIELRRRSPLKKLMMVAYNGSSGPYSPPLLGFEQGSYEVMRGPARSREDTRVPMGGNARTLVAYREQGRDITERIVEMLGRLA